MSSPAEESRVIIAGQSIKRRPEIIPRTSQARDTLYDDNITSFPAKVEDQLTYSWQNLQVSVRSKGNNNNSDRSQVRDEEKSLLRWRSKDGGGTKQLLFNVTGIAKPKELVAILGASGAGKTTLLNALTFRDVPGLEVSGERCVNGEAVDNAVLKAISAYVTQDEMYIPCLTVREHLTFNAKLRMNRYVSAKDRRRRVEQVIDELGLWSCADTRIGEPGRKKGISGGEARRLNFASEILTDPSILFCDEPTSGLDSFMAHTVVQVLKNLANKGKTVVCTVHQPSSQVYSMFDRLILMAEGRNAYVGQRTEILQYFNQLGYPCPSDFNPADYFIQVLSVDPARELEDRQRLSHLCSSYESSGWAQRVQNEIRASQSRFSSFIQTKKEDLIKRASGSRASWLTQFLVVFHRTGLASLKNPVLIRARILTMMLVALLYGLVYYGQTYDQDGVTNITGVLFLLVVSTTFQAAMNVILTFCLDFHLFRKEYSAGFYRIDTYFLGKTLAELPLFLLQPVISTSVIYYMVGLAPGWDKYFRALLIITLVLNTSVSFGYFVSCLATKVNVALAIGPALLVPLMLFGGFYMNTRSTPVYLQWIKWLSWFFYGHEALMVNQWENVSEIACNRQGSLASTCVSNGTMVLESLGFEQANFGSDSVILLVLAICFRIAAFLLLVLKTRVT